MARVGVVTFPGTNCDRETQRAFASVPGVEVVSLWHKDAALEDLQLIVLPGGFSYGDYLRAGAIARFSPLMSAIVDFAHAGGFVLGICNGFQVLCESGLLPGALIKNRDLRFVARDVRLRIERTDTPWTCLAEPGQVLRVPVAHGDGNYVDHDDAFARLEADGRVLVRYVDAAGEPVAAANPNGSLANAAGVLSPGHNVFGLMPHPERAADRRLGNADGRLLLESVVHWIDTHQNDAAEATA